MMTIVYTVILMHSTHSRVYPDCAVYCRVWE